MNKRGIDDPESGAYEDDARALERELAAVVRRVMAEELEKPEFRRQLESAVAKAIREQVGAQKRTLKEEGEGLRRTLSPGARAGGQEEDLLRGEHGPMPVARGKAAAWGERREEGSWMPRWFREQSWIPWLLGGCLVLVVGWGVWFAVDKFHPRSGERGASQEAANDLGDSAGPAPGTAADGGKSDDPAATDEAPPAAGALDAIWLREIRAAEGTLAAGSPLFASTPQTQLDCFFPQETRDRLERRDGQLDGDLAGDFDPCVRQKYPLGSKAPLAPNAAVFAAQALAKKLLLSKEGSGLPWCPKADLGKVQPSQVKPDGVAGPATFTLLRAVMPCLGAKGLTFDAKSPVETYLALSYTALGEIARLGS